MGQFMNLKAPTRGTTANLQLIQQVIKYLHQRIKLYSLKIKIEDTQNISNKRSWVAFQSTP